MNSFRILTGDVREMLRELPDQSVQTCVTSPPYWGLRDYGHAGQLGLEASPEAYVASMVGVFAEVRRVLRDDGTVWLNLGDSYTSIGRSGRKESPGVGATQEMRAVDREVVWAPRDEGDPNAHFQWSLPGGQKPKDLVGIPWMVAFALRADGWYLRSDIIWSKPNPMPESVTDRPTKAHEYIFLLSKSRSYYYNADAIAEQASGAMLMQVEQGYSGLGLKDYESAGAQNPSTVKGRIIENARKRAEKKRGQCFENTGNIGMDERWSKERRAEIFTRNKRSVWEVTTQPYPEAHFATYPEKLIEPCILAGSKEGDTVLDPFTGSGTTGAVSIRLQRNFIGCELNPEYVKLATKRIQSVAPLFTEDV